MIHGTVINIHVHAEETPSDSFQSCHPRKHCNKFIHQAQFKSLFKVKLAHFKESKSGKRKVFHTFELLNYYTFIKNLIIQQINNHFIFHL